MHLVWFLAQAAPASPGNPATAPPSIPVDEGAFGLSVVVATLMTLLVLFVVCSPIRRD